MKKSIQTDAPKNAPQLHRLAQRKQSKARAQKRTRQEILPLDTNGENMSDYRSYREEKLKFYLKAIDVLRRRSDLALDDLYSDAIKEAGLMWNHFSQSIADHQTF